MADDDYRGFQTADYVVFAVALAAATGMGIYYGLADILCKKGMKDEKEVLIGGREMSVIPVSFSILATFVAGPFLLGTTAEMYVFGTVFFLVMGGYVLATPFIAHFFIPAYHRLQFTSMYEYFEKRFSKTIRRLSSMTFILLILLYMSVVIYAPALAFSQVTNLSMILSILGVGLTCTLYTAFGGLKAVMWIDVLLMLIILAALVACVIKGTIDVGGLAAVWRISSEGGRIIFDEFDPNPLVRHTFWTQVLAGTVMTLIVLGTNQAIVQKFLSIRDVKKAQMTPYITLSYLLVYFSLLAFLGLVMYAYYAECDPLTRAFDRVEKPDQLLPLFVVDVFRTLPGLPGLFTAAVFSATLSTVAAGINGLAAVSLMDFIMPAYIHFKKAPMPGMMAKWLSKGLTVFFGGVTIGMAYLAPFFGSGLLQLGLSIFGLAGGPLLGLVILGFCFPFSNSWGAGVGLVTSLVFVFWIAIGAIASNVGRTYFRLPLDNTCPAYQDDPSNVTTILGSTLLTTPFDNSTTTRPPDPFNPDDILSIYKLSYMWYCVLSTCTTVVVGLVVSALTGCRKGKEIRPEYLFTPKAFIKCLGEYGGIMVTDDAKDNEDSEKVTSDKNDAENGVINRAFDESEMHDSTYM